MAKVKEEKKEIVAAPSVPLPSILKKQSMFSGSGGYGAKSPTVKFTPKTFRITQHKGG